MVFSKNMLIDLAGARSLERGASYHTAGKVSKLIKRGDVYEAAVQGSVSYQQTIDLRAELAEGNCSCPYSQGGWCKHLVAVGLAILGEEYTEVAADFDETISGESIPFQQFWEKNWLEAEEQLRSRFMQQLFDKQPDLQAQFLSFVGQKEDNIQLVNIEKLKKEIEEEFQSTDIMWKGTSEENERLYLIADNFQNILEAYASKMCDYLDTDKYMDGLRSLLAIYEACFLVKSIEELDYLWDILLSEFELAIYSLSSTIASSIISTALAKQMLKLIFERWDRFEAKGGDITYGWETFIPLIKALTADKVTAHYLKTLLDTYSLNGDDVADLHSHIT